jgi:hypothetical protein
VENRIRPIALGRQNWLFAGSLRAGKRAAAIISSGWPDVDGRTDRGVAAASLAAGLIALIRLELAGCVARALTQHDPYALLHTLNTAKLHGSCTQCRAGREAMEC